MEEFLLLTVI
uniref:Uncharacterized protein n=1 Tax=Rhizophora mucronata TaxID=61149 RepID=A0A2P2K0J8_RHIMU